MTIDHAALIRFCNSARALARVCSLPCGDPAELAELCRQAAGEADDELATGLRLLADQLVIAGSDDLARSFARLFLGPFRVLVPPYASWFLEKDQQMMGPIAQATAEAYAAAGVGPGDGPRELPDHIGLELEFCYLLGFRAIEDGNDDALAQLQAFWQQQLHPWLPRFAAAVAEHADHPVFSALARALQALDEHGPVGQGSA